MESDQLRPCACMEPQEPEGFMPPLEHYPPASPSQASLLGEEAHRDLEQLDDEGLMANQPAFVGLFQPSLFRSLLLKAKKAANMGASETAQEAAPGLGDLEDSLFSEPAVEREVVPSPRLFL